MSSPLKYCFNCCAEKELAAPNLENVFHVSTRAVFTDFVGETWSEILKIPRRTVLQ